MTTLKMSLLYSRKRAQRTDCFGTLEVAFERAMNSKKSQFVGATAIGYQISSDIRDFPLKSVYQVSPVGEVSYIRAY